MSLISVDPDTETPTIKSSIGGAQVTIRRYDSDGIIFYDFSATLGQRSVTNDAVSFCSVPGFLSSLDTFERSRDSEALLEGTYDCSLTVRPHNLRGDAWLEFRVGEHLMLERRPVDRGLYGRYSLTGGLSVSGGDVALLRDSFQQLFSEQAFPSA